MPVKIAEPDLADQVDLGAEAKCSLMWADTETPACNNPAAWANRLGCCGYVKIICEPHHAIIDQMEEFTCRRCRTRRPPVTLAWRV